MRILAATVCLTALLLTSWPAVAPAAATYHGQCGSILSFRDGTNHKIRYAVVTRRHGNCRTARRVMASYLNRLGRYARAHRCSGTRCTNAAPRGWACGLTSYAARHRGRLADCARRSVKAQAWVWPRV